MNDKIYNYAIKVTSVAIGNNFVNSVRTRMERCTFRMSVLCCFISHWPSRSCTAAIDEYRRSLSTGTEIVPSSKNAWSYTSTLQYASMAWCSV